MLEHAPPEWKKSLSIWWWFSKFRKNDYFSRGKLMYVVKLDAKVKQSNAWILRYLYIKSHSYKKYKDFFSRIQVLLTKFDLKSSFNSGLEIWIVHLADGDSSDWLPGVEILGIEHSGDTQVASRWYPAGGIQQVASCRCQGDTQVVYNYSIRMTHVMTN